MKNEEKWTVYYDGDCPLCTRAVRGLSRLDFFRRLKWKPYQALPEPPAGLSWGDLDQALYLETGDGAVHRGFHALRKLALRLVPLIPLAPFLWLPGAGVIGAWAYRWLAGNRYRISGGSREGNSKPPRTPL